MEYVTRVLIDVFIGAAAGTLLGILCGRYLWPRYIQTPAAGEALSQVFGQPVCITSCSLGDVLDVPKEIARLQGEIAGIEKAIASSQARLDKPSFVERAPAEVVEKERSKVTEGTAQIARLRANLESLSK